MANITRNATLSQISPGTAGAMKAGNLAGDYFAGEAIDAAGVPCRIHSDGTIRKTNGTALDASAQCDGFSAAAYAVGDAVTLLGPNTVFGRYCATPQTPGTSLYASATAGLLDTTATTGNPAAGGALARVLKDGVSIRVLRYL